MSHSTHSGTKSDTPQSSRSDEKASSGRTEGVPVRKTPLVLIKVALHKQITDFADIHPAAAPAPSPPQLVPCDAPLAFTPPLPQRAMPPALQSPPPDALVLQQQSQLPAAAPLPQQLPALAAYQMPPEWHHYSPQLERQQPHTYHVCMASREVSIPVEGGGKVVLSVRGPAEAHATLYSPYGHCGGHGAAVPPPARPVRSAWPGASRRRAVFVEDGYMGRPA